MIMIIYKYWWLLAGCSIVQQTHIYKIVIYSTILYERVLEKNTILKSILREVNNHHTNYRYYIRLNNN